MALNIVKRPPQNGAAVEFVEDGRGDCLTSIVLLSVCTVLGERPHDWRENKVRPKTFPASQPFVADSNRKLITNDNQFSS